MAIFKNYDVNAILMDDDAYKNMKKDILAAVMEDFDIRKKKTVAVIGEDSHEMTIANFFTNLVVWNPFNTFKQEVTSDFVIDATNIDGGMLSSYFTRVINELQDVDEDYDRLNFSISRVIKELADASGEFNVRIGNSMSIYSLIELGNRNEEFRQLLHYDIPDGLQFNEIETELSDKTKRMIQILSEEDNILRNYIRSKTGINVKQLSQSILNVGLKPDLFGNVIPEPIDTSYLRGLRNVTDFYINATGARKALITNFKQVKNAGYLTRKLSLLMIDTILDYEYEDCGTSHLIRCEMESADSLSRLTGRWYLEEGAEEYEMLTLESTDVIGKTIWMRSPITCAHPEKKICRTCYGDNLAKLNRNLHVGILGVLLLTNQLTQKLLSSKHLLQTRSSKIDWPEEFLETFSVDRNMIMLNEMDNVTIIIDSDDINDDDENNTRWIDTFTVKKGKKIVNKVKSPMNLVLTDEVTQQFDNTKTDEDIYEIPVKLFNPDSVIFTYTMENNELSASLHSILELIETNSHLGLTDIHDIYNRFLSLLNESDLNLNSVHAELILRELTRQSSSNTQRPDFTQPVFPDYTVLRVTDAILKSPSVSISMAFEQIKKQLMLPETYEKNGKSLLDHLL